MYEPNIQPQFSLDKPHGTKPQKNWSIKQKMRCLYLDQSKSRLTIENAYSLML